MFAIKLVPPNHAAIIVEMGSEKFTNMRLPFFSERPYPYYLVSGYVNNWGQFLGWVILPEAVLKSYFEYNPDVIQTDWDQIVRKETKK